VVPHTDSGSVLHFPNHCKIGCFRIFIYLHFSYSHHPMFTQLGETTDADKIMNPQHFGRDLADIWI